MKKTLLTFALITVSFLSTQAQTVEPSTQATWVVESNESTPKVQTINFYNDQHQLMYSETINKRLNISKRKVQKTLNSLLANLLKAEPGSYNKNVLAASFKLKP